MKEGPTRFDSSSGVLLGATLLTTVGMLVVTSSIEAVASERWYGGEGEDGAVVITGIDSDEDQSSDASEPSGRAPASSPGAYPPPIGSVVTDPSAPGGPERDPCSLPWFGIGVGLILPGVCDSEESGGDGGAEFVASPPQIISIDREEFQQLPISSGGLFVQPDRDWVLVNVGTIVYTGAAPHTLHTTILGVDIEVHVEPVSFVWDFGDGSDPMETTDPGAPWPEATVSHAYTSAGQAQISLTTHWEGMFRPVGAEAWIPIVGRATTTESSRPFEIRTSTPRLVGSTG